MMANTFNAYIRMYTNSSDVILPDFDDVTKITDVSVFQYFALGATPLVKAVYTIDGISVKDQHPDNAIYKFIDNEAEKGNYIYDFCYIDDVCKTAAVLFGNENPVLFDFNKGNINIDFGAYTTTFAIYAEVGIITTNADINYSEPQIMDYEKTDTGYICETLILPEHRMVDEVEITQDNISHYIDKMPKYRFTFTENGDTFVLSGLKKVT
jgi:hypothetical protein